MNRIDLLHSLVQFNQPLHKTLSLLSAFGWASKSELIMLERQYVSDILKRYIADKLSPADVEDWANAIESREDMGYDPKCEELLGEIIYDLANPLLTRPLSKDLAKDWVAQLTQIPVAAKSK